jgi:transposase
MVDVSCTWHGRTIGVDLGDKYSHLCVLDGSGAVTEEARVATTRKQMLARFQGLERSRVVIETGTHTNWVAETLASCGHEVVVANARKARAIFGNPRKDDRTDAECLARIGRVDAKLLHPVTPRDARCCRHLALLRGRKVLVRARTQLINHVRGIAKSAGFRLPSRASASFHKLAMPEELEGSLGPVVSVIADLTARIAILDERVEALCELEYPQTQQLMAINGVGPQTSLYFVLIVGDPRCFKSARAVGSYLGLTPRRDASGARDPELSITKAGDPLMRELLVQAAHHILGPFGRDSDLRRFGLQLAARGGKNAKKKAVVATARKLAVLLAALLRTGEVYRPLRHGAAAELELSG